MAAWQRGTLPLFLRWSKPSRLDWFQESGGAARRLENQDPPLTSEIPGRLLAIRARCGRSDDLNEIQGSSCHNALLAPARALPEAIANSFENQTSRGIRKDDQALRLSL